HEVQGSCLDITEQILEKHHQGRHRSEAPILSFPQRVLWLSVPVIQVLIKLLIIALALNLLGSPECNYDVIPVKQTLETTENQTWFPVHPSTASCKLGCDSILLTVSKTTVNCLCPHASAETTQAVDQDVELSAPSPVPCLPAYCQVYHHDGNGLNI
ncbi:hypothetical protein LEMLEM_LOCUS14142, partial [Lemmus lemmus]